MAITSGFFNSIDGDRKYNAEDIGHYFDKLISSGVYPTPGDSLQVMAGSGMQVRVQPGRAMLDCHYLNSDAILNLSIAASDVTFNRIDAVVMRLDLRQSARNAIITIKKGAVSSSPAAPSMSRTDTVKEWCLATVLVKAKATSITQANITDTRANTTVCGWVTGLINQVDTSTLFEQWRSAYDQFYTEMEAWKTAQKQAFDTWMQTLTDELRVDMYLNKQQRVITLTDFTVRLPVDLVAGSHSIWICHANGVLLTEGEDFVITDGYMEFSEPMEAGNIITIMLLEAKNGAPPV